MAGSEVVVRVDNRIRVPLDAIGADVAALLERACEHANPDYPKRLAMGYSTFGVPKTIKTWQRAGGDLTLPRGAMGRLRAILSEAGMVLRTVDDRSEGGYMSKPITYVGHPLRVYQADAVEVALAREQGIIRAATGAGKTTVALNIAANVGLNTLVIVPSVKLLDQTAEVAGHLLGLGGQALGVMQGAKRRLRPLTLATQQTLWSRTVDAELRGYFGCVIVDEAHHCFGGETPILMANGRLRSISKIVVGDEVAVGGKVVATMSRRHTGEVVVVNDVIVTTEHPFATSEGWKTAGALDKSSNLLYDPSHGKRLGMSSLRFADALELPRRHAPEVRAEGLQDRRDVRSVRNGGSPKVSRHAHLQRMWNQEALERGLDGRNLIGTQGDGRCAAGDTKARIDQIDACPMARSGGTGSPTVGAVTGSSGQIQADRRTRGQQYAGEVGNPGWQTHTVRSGGLGQWAAPYEVGGGPPRSVDAVGVRPEPCHQDGSAGRWVTDPLQDRSRSPREEGSGRNRWLEPQGAGGGGRTEDLLPRVEGLEGLTLPGGVRLRPGRAGLSIRVWASLTTHNLETENGIYVAGGMLVHNSAARTHAEVIGQFPSRYRFAMTADERRKDRKEFLVYDAFGDVVHETTRADAEESGAVVDVEVRIVPTPFRAPWYREEADFNQLLDQMVGDARRNEIALEIAREEALLGEQMIVLTHRRDHVRVLDLALASHGVRTGCMLGGQDAGDEAAFEATRTGLRDGSIQAGVGTYGALGEGIDLPAVAVGIAATPISANKQKFNQVRGRLCRPSAGKTHGRLYVLFDPHVFDERALGNILAWNKNVKVRVGGIWVDAREHRRAIMDTRAA